MQYHPLFLSLPRGNGSQRQCDKDMVLPADAKKDQRLNYIHKSSLTCLSQITQSTYILAKGGNKFPKVILRMIVEGSWTHGTLPSFLHRHPYDGLLGLVHSQETDFSSVKISRAWKNGTQHDWFLNPSPCWIRPRVELLLPSQIIQPWMNESTCLKEVSEYV